MSQSLSLCRDLSLSLSLSLSHVAVSLSLPCRGLPALPSGHARKYSGHRNLFEWVVLGIFESDSEATRDSCFKQSSFNSELNAARPGRARPGPQARASAVTPPTHSDSQLLSRAGAAGLSRPQFVWPQYKKTKGGGGLI